MKNILSKFICDDREVSRALKTLLLIPVFLSCRTLFDALYAVIVSSLLSVLSIGISVIIDRFAEKVNKLPAVIVLSGAFGIFLSTVSYKLIDRADLICFCSVLYSIYLYLMYESNKSLQKTKITLKVYSFSACTLLIFAILRELLSSGKIFSGFTENGIQLFGHKFGSYINTASYLFVAAAIALFICNCFNINVKAFKIGHISHIKVKGFAVLSVAVCIISSLLSFVTFFIQSSFNDNNVLSVVLKLLPYVLVSILTIPIGLVFEKEYTNTVALLVLAETLYMTNSGGAMIINMIMICAVTVISACFCEFFRIRSTSSREYICIKDIPMYLTVTSIITFITELIFL